MKTQFKVLVLFVILCSSCQQEDLDHKPILQTSTETELFSKSNRKINVCHKGKIINIASAALKAHIAHGDAIDMDNDGFYSIENSCSEIVDCDDTNSEIYPGAEEIIDGVDNNCDGVIDEGFCEVAEVGDDIYGGTVFWVDPNDNCHGLVYRSFGDMTWYEAFEKFPDEGWYFPNREVNYFFPTRFTSILSEGLYWKFNESEIDGTEASTFAVSEGSIHNGASFEFPKSTEHEVIVIKSF